MTDHFLYDDTAPNVFRTIHTRFKASLNIFLHLFIYNYAMLAMTTSLPPFIVPRSLDFSIQVPHVVSLIFPMTAAFIAYLSASFIFTHVNIYVDKQLIPIPYVSKRSRSAYPMLAGLILFVVGKEVFNTLGGRHAWIWTLRLCACCFVEALFLFLLVLVCSTLFPKFGEGAGPLIDNFLEHNDEAV